MRRLAHVFSFAVLALAVSIQLPASAADSDEVKALLTDFKSAMKSDDAAARKSAVETVSATKDKKVARALVKHLGDSDPGVRAAVCKAIGEQGDERAAAKLLALLRREEVTSVRVAICDALARTPTRKTVNELGDLANELLNVCRDEEVAQAAIRAKTYDPITYLSGDIEIAPTVNSVSCVVTGRGIINTNGHRVESASDLVAIAAKITLEEPAAVPE